jgi:hypothetical protein
MVLKETMTMTATRAELLDQLDQSSAGVATAFQDLGEFCITIRTINDTLRFIYPKRKPQAVANLLNRAAEMILAQRFEENHRVIN